MLKVLNYIYVFVNNLYKKIKTINNSLLKAMCESLYFITITAICVAAFLCPTFLGLGLIHLTDSIIGSDGNGGKIVGVILYAFLLFTGMFMLFDYAEKEKKKSKEKEKEGDN